MTGVPKSGKLLPVFFLIIIVLTSGCANIGTISGGPKDEAPPRLVRSVPPAYSTNFSGNSLEIEFDEYVDLRNAQQQFVVSPPLSEKPEIKVKKKSVEVRFKASLAPFTTYSCNFGDAIVDLNEGNPLKDFRFIFSTGPTIDSLCLTGKVVQARDGLPSPETLVLLYLDPTDSAPLVRIPDYLSRTRPDGSFELANLRGGNYRLFALKDANSNFLFDPGSEGFGFQDTLVTLSTPSVEENSALPVDSMRDSIPGRVKPPCQKLEFPLRLFEEDLPELKLKSADRPLAPLLRFAFNKRCDSLPEIQVDGYTGINPLLFSAFSPLRDSVFAWLGDSVLWKADTVTVLLRYQASPVGEKSVIQIDTLRLAYRSQGANKAKPGWSLSTYPIPGGALPLEKKPVLKFSQPLQSIDKGRVEIYEVGETGLTAIPFRLDSIAHGLQIQVEAEWTEGRKVRIKALPGAFRDYYSGVSDSLNWDFSVVKKTPSGNLNLRWAQIPPPGFVVVLTEKYQEVTRKKTEQSNTLIINDLLPGKYRVRYFSDENGNGFWDTGRYLRKKQPEKLVSYPEPIEIRANWDLEVNLSLP